MARGAEVGACMASDALVAAPHVPAGWQRRRCTQVWPMGTHSSQPTADEVTVAAARTSMWRQAGTPEIMAEAAPREQRARVASRGR